jgi:hypothetical protein
MRFGLTSLVVASLLGLAGCGPTFTRGAAGWRESGLPYTIAPLPNGDLVPAGWTLDGFTTVSGGYRRDPVESSVDLQLDRVEDDGVLVVKSYPLESDDAAKRPEVLLERWLDTVVEHPSADADPKLYDRVVPPIKTTATGSVGLRAIESTVVSGRNVSFDKRETFSVPGGEAAEAWITAAPRGSPPDRRLYVVVQKQTSPELRYAVVAYGNTPSMFDGGLADATSFAHRIHF